MRGVYSNLIGDEPLCEFFEVIQSHKNLTCFDFGKNYLGSEPINSMTEVIKSNEMLKTLTLDSCDISVENFMNLVKPLQENKTLTNLNLSHNKSMRYHQGMKLLVEVLKMNESITILDISYNHVQDEDFDLLLNQLESKCNITSLDISNIRLTDKGVIRLGEFMKKDVSIKNLNIGDHNILTKPFNDFLDCLNENKILESLGLAFVNPSLPYCTHFADDVSRFLMKNKKLLSLNLLTYSGLRNADLQLIEALNENSTLTSLNLRSIYDRCYELSDNFFSKIKFNTSLVEIEYELEDKDLAKLLKKNLDIKKMKKYKEFKDVDVFNVKFKFN